jgi:hypothetical protein
MAAQDSTYDAVITTLKSYPPPLLPSGHAYNSQTTASIASLQLHPSLEAALHILNHDLPGAHFLVRHMEAPPAVEGMTLHAILHRIEGDYDNARAWYRDVAGNEQGLGLLEGAWGQDATDAVLGFVNEVEACSKSRLKDKDSGGEKRKRLEEKSLNEIMAMVMRCEEKFGTEKWEDASSAWTRSPEKNRKMGQAMTTGGQGFRKF